MNRSPCVWGENGRISGLKKGLHSRVCMGSAISTTVSVLENVSFPCVQPQPVPRNRVKVDLLVVNSAGDGNLRHTPSFSRVCVLAFTVFSVKAPGKPRRRLRRSPVCVGISWVNFSPFLTERSIPVRRFTAPRQCGSFPANPSTYWTKKAKSLDALLYGGAC